jgi:hypothetical protein
LLCSGSEVNVSRRTLGFLAVIGSAVGAWRWTTQRGTSTAVRRLPARDHGTVIFENHVPASDIADAIL